MTTIMTTITEDYVSFETAKLLKEKGFNEPCHATYDTAVTGGKPIFSEYEVLSYFPYGMKNTDDKYDMVISAPTQAMACDWLEKQYGIFIQINRYHQYYEGREVIAVTKEDKERGHMTMYYARVFDKHSVSNTTEHYDSIEFAYNEALKHVLTNLI